jgi:hypothetical protein
MDTLEALRIGLDPSRLLRACGLEPDPWQRDVLRSAGRQILLNCCRQAGKSTVVGALALHEALYRPCSLTLILSPGQRQSAETFRKVLDAYRAAGAPVRALHRTPLRLELANGSRVLSLPGAEETVRGYSPSLLVIDEAARVPDDLYRACRPMLAVSRGRLVALSTPFGRRGWFWREWHGPGRWHRVRVPWTDCPRIDAVFIAEEERALGPTWVAQEYRCAFESQVGLVYPDFARCLTDAAAPPGRAVGGIDWGWRNPFAAVWGVADAAGVLWITGERYLRATPLEEHARALPRGVLWDADPAGATEINAFRRAGHLVRPGLNDLRVGIAAVTARVRTGRLKVRATACPNLVAEAQHYRYPDVPDETATEAPIDAHNHALAALRYLIARLDEATLARGPRPKPPGDAQEPPLPADFIEAAWMRLG